MQKEIEVEGAKEKELFDKFSNYLIEPAEPEPPPALFICKVGSGR